MLEKNKITRAKFLIFKYVDDLHMEIRALSSDTLDEFTNLPAHQLNRDELTILLWEMFGAGDLVAWKNSKGYFSPTLNEIETALNEPSELPQRSENTFYGYVSAASESYKSLKDIWENEIFKTDSNI